MTDTHRTTALDAQHCYQAMTAHDSRFDGRFFVGVSTTRIYCRPICRVKLPKADRCTFYPSAAAAEQAGYRPCLRCRPELAPGLSREDAVARLAHRAASKIRAGALTGGSLEDLSASLNISSRQLRRAIEQEFGVSPIALAQSYRLLAAKQLLTDTRLRATDVAFASGFSSVRRFNAAFREHYRLNPSQLRKLNGNATSQPTLTLRMAYRPPLAWDGLIHFLNSRGAEGSSLIEHSKLYKTLRIGELSGWFMAQHDPARHQVTVELSGSLTPVFAQLSVKLRQYFDLDASPQQIDAHLSQHPLLKRCVQKNPGLRLPGTLDVFELAARAIIGQQISVKAASTVFKRMVLRFGDAIATPHPALNIVCPDAKRIAEASLQDIIELGLNARRATTLHTVAKAFNTGELAIEYGCDSSEACAQLQRLPGIGPWTAQYIALRALGDPNAFPSSDLGLMKALQLDKPAAVEQASLAWQPWRAYAAIHLWQHLSSGG